MTLLILLLDTAVLAAAIEMTSWVIKTWFFPGADVGFRGVTVSATAGLVFGVATSYLTGLHQSALLIQRKEVAFRSLLVGVATAMGILLTSHFVWYQALGRTALLFAALSSAASVMAWRLVYARYVERGPRLKVIVLGNGPKERALARRLEEVRHARYRVVGVLGERVDESDEVEVLGTFEHAVDVCRRHDVGTVMVISSGEIGAAQRAALTALRVSGFQIATAEGTLMALLRRAPLEIIDERWLLHLFEQLQQGRDRVKRVLDVGVACAGLAVLAAMLPLLWPLVRLESAGPFFFVQTRVGLGNRPFQLYKIRTMTVDERAGEERWAGHADQRTTRIGRILRRLRLDELPQFWNVLRGDMSVVGPRPEQPTLAAQLEREITYFSYRHLVKPGITGWAQIHHGYVDSIEESRTKLAYDLYYVRHHTLTLDIDIMLRTAFVMLARIGSR
jgi:exopolysaccharide biosynthesis polyprenyl glycosylphosphotransferase